MASELGVQTIQHTNGTDALTVGSDGVVTAAQYVKQSGVPAFVAYHSDNVGSIDCSTAYQVIHNSTEINIGSCYNTTTGEFTAPVDGIYWLQYQAGMRFDSVGEKPSMTISFNKNGALFRYTDHHIDDDPVDGSTRQWWSHTITAVAQLTAGDAITCLMYTGASSGNYFLSNRRDCFQGYLIG